MAQKIIRITIDGVVHEHLVDTIDLVEIFAGTVASGFPVFRAVSTLPFDLSLSQAVAKPVGVAEGDIMLAGLAWNSGPGTVTAPIGWALVAEQNQGGMRLMVYQRVAGALEPADYTWSWTNSRRGIIGIIAYDVDVVDPVDAFGGALDNTVDTLAVAPAIVTGQPDTVLVALFAGWHAGSFEPPAGMTERFDVQAIGGAPTLMCATEERAAEGDTGSRTATQSAAAEDRTVMISLRK